MSGNRLEHTNITVSDPKATAAWLGDVFGWRIRWEGPGMQTGYSVHIGGDDSYVALFTFGDARPRREESYRTVGGLNHIAVFVEDPIAEVETRVRAAGFTPRSHADYAPGKRFYFHDGDGIEWEVASHQT